ncbi:4-hydroxy-2-oxoheptanedioate aldolase [Virgibacillus subterraneus]|uniref:4-hydroxy-2-oxoheptanedioate aldolase n=1 Tax=Virgibacillus subterraneus TaxID=621109 RepID=A0A1H9G6I9_9BACI|nr:aldolase/citrate lyase family protein [Virgibacillus subterraneus]SEQ45775.1 4-hydroxy-2-oxoheptanedioate aldolase [Virgibacillus subterraneus]
MYDQVRMRPSRVMSKLRKGQTATCMKINLADARVIEIAAMAGFDCLWTDMEHVPNDLSAIEKQILAGKAHQIDVIVRVPRGSYSDHIKPLEMDAAGIMVPHVLSLADAKQIIKYTKFHPLGLRPLDGGNADGAYCNINLTDYMEQANRERFNILQIEDPVPIDELEEIISLPGLDMVFFGPGDFSQAIGAPGQFNHPQITEMRKRIAHIAQEKGKFAGTVGGVQNFESLTEMGYQFISVGADVFGLSQYCKDIIDNLLKVGMPKHCNIYEGK